MVREHYEYIDGEADRDVAGRGPVARGIGTGNVAAGEGMTETHGTVKKLINDPSSAVDEMLEAFVSAHGDLVSFAESRAIGRAVPASDKVGVSIGGGSGHEPAMVGYVGVGMADTVAVGNMFSAPGADAILESIRCANHGKGVVVVYGNYSGDVLNCRLAGQRAAAEGIDMRAVFVTDDVASAPQSDIQRRRGIAGLIVVWKIAGAAAESRGIDEVERITKKANDNTRTMGVALTGAELPGATKPIFECGPHDMEVGIGVHGEPGEAESPCGRPTK